MMHAFEHIDAPDLKTAIALLGQPETEGLAGGTDLLGELKRGIREPKRLVNLKTISGLDEIRFDRDLHLGPLVTLAEIEQDPAVQESYPMLSQALSLTATPQLRNMGTLGGNLCQHPRCWYFRDPLFPCWLKGGSRCFAVAGENKFHSILGSSPCHSVHPSDLAPALMALDARVTIAGPDGDREIPLEGLYRNPDPQHRQTTVLNRGEILREIHLPPPLEGAKAVYLKMMERKAWSFALVSVAAQVTADDGRIAAARIVLGGVAPIPWRSKEAEQVMIGQACSEETMKHAGEAAVAGAKPLRDNSFKVSLVKAAIKALPREKEGTP